MFQLLCDRNCNTKTKDKLGDTCLHKMVLRGDVKTCQVLSRVCVFSHPSDCGWHVIRLRAHARKKSLCTLRQLLMLQLCIHDSS